MRRQLVGQLFLDVVSHTPTVSIDLEMVMISSSDGRQLIGLSDPHYHEVTVA